MKKEVSSTCFARAGLLGNPSDGYHGKAISFSIRNFAAKVNLNESSTIEFGDNQTDRFGSFSDVSSLDIIKETDGGERLLKSALRRWLQHHPNCIEAPVPNFQVRFSSNIPRQVGMAGSSAIVIAALRAYSVWFDKEIQPEILASLALAAEHDLGISAGLQDRVIQSFEGLMYMDFDSSKMHIQNDLAIGQYERLDPSLLSNLYVAYARNIPESTEVLHGDLKQKYESGDQRVIETISGIADIAHQGITAIQNCDQQTLCELIDRNFDLRQSICVLNPGHVRMIEIARSCGASAKYCGSGGAIVGTYKNSSDLELLQQQMEKNDCVVFEPELI